MNLEEQKTLSKYNGEGQYYFLIILSKEFA